MTRSKEQAGWAGPLPQFLAEPAFAESVERNLRTLLPGLNIEKEQRVEWRRSYEFLAQTLRPLALDGAWVVAEYLLPGRPSCRPDFPPLRPDLNHRDQAPLPDDQ